MDNILTKLGLFFLSSAFLGGAAGFSIYEFAHNSSDAFMIGSLFFAGMFTFLFLLFFVVEFRPKS